MTQENWILEELERYEQRIHDQQTENAIRREVLKLSLLKSKINAGVYNG
ncbi:hypothetical protein NEF87_000244 [Candidatus Lokiarchaeum ossiferum]|uniref:Uncharacterized protein n=1 Tax=Candidatus Lokiarchaeum ossiferum TaxID=2951803 RepID=A0ABY6HKA9_9ARCH|nr:hypothetical protein NEF87_000244 [Candidatus Lokiarchaeum sp. B-35]